MTEKTKKVDPQEGRLCGEMAASVAILGSWMDDKDNPGQKGHRYKHFHESAFEPAACLLMDLGLIDSSCKGGVLTDEIPLLMNIQDMPSFLEKNPPSKDRFVETLEIFFNIMVDIQGYAEPELSLVSGGEHFRNLLVDFKFARKIDGDYIWTDKIARVIAANGWTDKLKNTAKYIEKRNRDEEQLKKTALFAWQTMPSKIRHHYFPKDGKKAGGFIEFTILMNDIWTGEKWSLDRKEQTDTYKGRFTLLAKEIRKLAEQET